jgi:signal transduction histidine kinase
MAAIDWFRPPRSVLTLYLTGASVARACVTWLAITQVNSDKLAETQRSRQRLAGVADRVAVRLQQGLSDLDRMLVDRTSSLPEHAVLARGDGQSIIIERGSLPFVPVAPPSTAVPVDAFADAEAAELSATEFDRAAGAYRRLASSSSRAVRARALIGLGRVLRRAGRHADAVQAYTGLIELNDVVIEGRPADLIARIGVCRALSEGGQHARFTAEATAVRAGLADGKWPVTGAVWHAMFGDEALSAGVNPLPADLKRRVAAAEALEAFWREWREGTLAGPLLASSEAGSGLVVWTREASAVRVLVVESGWLTALWSQAATDAGVDVALVDGDGRPLVGRLPAATAVSLASAETGLPWTIAVADAHPERTLRDAAARRRTFLAGLGMVGLLIVGSGYFTFRGIRRELAIARMHAHFVSAASHEFRTPLTSIRQLSHMLQDGRVENDNRRGQYYQVLVRESERLHRLVERLLSFGRAEAGRLHTEPLDARELGSAVAKDFQRRLSDRRIDVAVPDVPCPVRADREMLSLAVWNLLDNAVKYSPEGEPVHLEVSGGDGRVRMTVRDRGVGVPPEDRRRIFEQFVRGSDPAASSAPGSGLGLALVDRVVQAHGGDVQIESEVGRGSVFTISLPMETGP